MIGGRRGASANVAFTLWLALLPASADAQHALGVQAGGSANPEQFYAGVFWHSPDIADRLALRIGVDGSQGDGHSILAPTFDLLFTLPLGQSGWSLVQGGGGVIIVQRRDIEPFRSEFDGGGGASYVLNVAHASGFFAQVRVGVGDDVPGVKAGVGWTIPLGPR